MCVDHGGVDKEHFNLRTDIPPEVVGETYSAAVQSKRDREAYNLYYSSFRHHGQPIMGALTSLTSSESKVSIFNCLQFFCSIFYKNHFKNH